MTLKKVSETNLLTTLLDAEHLVGVSSEVGRLSITSLKALLKTYFDVFYGLSGLTYKGKLTLSAGMNLPAATLGDWYIAEGTSNWIGGTGPGDQGIYVNEGDSLECRATTVAGQMIVVGESWYHDARIISLPDGWRVFEMLSDTAATYVPVNGLRFLNDVLYVYQNSIGQPASPTRTAKQTGNLTESLAALANVAGAAFTMLAGHTYIFKFFGTYQSADTGNGLHFNFTSPALTHVEWRGSVRRAVQGTDAVEIADFTTFTGVAMITSAVNTADTDYSFIIEGVIKPSAAGTLQLQARTENSGTAIIVKNTVGTITDAG